MEYNFNEIEQKWQNIWEKTKLYETSKEALKKFYLLVMFAYPSGDIHMGHFRNYSVADVIARVKLMEGHDLLFPFGWDAFGLPAEGAAIKAGISPKEWTLNNINTSRNTLKKLGIAFDWNKEVTTCLPDYYKWTQWMFIQFMKAGLAYRKKAPANWCGTCNTVLANEQVSDGKCWRCHNEVDKKEMEQWFLRITDYSQELLDGLDTLPDWPENIKTMQKNWIGRSDGAEIEFPIENSDRKLSVFTTRPDTVCGVTFVAMAPEHEFADELTKGTENEAAAAEYIKQSRLKKDIDRMSTSTEKDGVFTGRFAINPFTGEKVQIWIGDYVLASYGTGVVMGVPAHDERDFQFAKKYNIPIKVVIQPENEKLDPSSMREAYTEEGIMINSGDFDGLKSTEGITKVAQAAEAKKFGRKTINYRLRDWLISRQRYWGAPIPVIHCEKCGAVPVSERDLPVRLPEGNIDLIPKGRSPLADNEEFMKAKCPLCGGEAKRDPDTMDTFMCSSWYFLRYTDPHNKDMAFDKEKCAKWMPADLYIGGAEHACMHLIYFRFFQKFLKNRGFVQNSEPAVKLFNHGMVLDDKGEIMSKSKGNVVSPVHLIKEHGVDTTRLAMFFACPSDKEVLWSDSYITGVKRFVQKFWQLYMNESPEIFKNRNKKFEFMEVQNMGKEEQQLYIAVQKLISRVKDDLERFQYNTAISALMEFTTLVSDYKGNKEVLAHALTQAVKLIAPLAPHMAEELWSYMGYQESIFKASWPTVNKNAFLLDTVTIVVQINGKVRERVELTQDVTEEEMKEMILGMENLKKAIGDKPIKKMITVPNKLVNIVI